MKKGGTGLFSGPRNLQFRPWSQDVGAYAFFCTPLFTSGGRALRVQKCSNRDTTKILGLIYVSYACLEKFNSQFSCFTSVWNSLQRAIRRSFDRTSVSWRPVQKNFSLMKYLVCKYYKPGAPATENFVGNISTAKDFIVLENHTNFFGFD